MSEPLLGLAVQEGQVALEVRCLADSGATGAQAEIQGQYEHTETETISKTKCQHYKMAAESVFYKVWWQSAPFFPKSHKNLENNFIFTTQRQKKEAQLNVE